MGPWSGRAAPRAGPVRGRAGTVILVALLLTAGALAALAGGGTGDGAPSRCPGLRIASWSADDRTTGAFARYGDDPGRLDDWTGGDGTHSVRLPDGRILWLFSDSFLGRVHGPPNPAGQPHAWREAPPGGPAWVRNSAVVTTPSGRPERTLTGGTAAAPAPLFPDVSARPRHWRWPVQALVEPRTPGAAEQVVRVLLWTRTEGPPPWLYGVPEATEVATLSLPGLRLEGIERIHGPGGPDPGRRVLYGTTAVRRGGTTYVYGGDEGPGATPARPSSYAYLARVPTGSLADRSAWRYWDGSGWRRDPARAHPVLGDGARHGVGSAFSVVRRGRTWVLLTMDAGGPRAAGLSTVATYWACSPQGPWRGPDRGFRAPLPPDSAPDPKTAAYSPQAHPEVGAGGRLLLSYDVNWLGPDSTALAHVNRNVSLYRPRFVRLRFGETAGGPPAPVRVPR